MDDFDEINELLSEKFEIIKYNISLIIFGENVCDYQTDSDLDRLFYKSGIYSKELKDAIDNGNQENMPERTQIAFSYLLNQAKEFDFSRTLDFIVFETLFYNLVTDSYNYQRHSAKSEDLISIELAKEIFEKKQYDYLSLIYEIIQLEFWLWLKYRDNFNCSDFPNNTNAALVGIHPTLVEKHIGTKEYWCKIKELASEAHTLFPEGELANRIMLISDVQLIYGVGKWKDVYDPANEELVKYLDIRKDSYGNPVFICDCFSDDFEDYNNKLGWITGLPHLETSPNIASSKCRNEKERKSFLDDCYKDIMLFPATIYFPQMDGQFLTSVANKIRYSNQLEEKNEALEKAQEDKKQIIAEFAHTYGNMQATTLQDIGTQLLSVDDDLLHEWGRKIMVEYAIKQNLTKEIEMLKFQFKDKTSDLLKMLRQTIVSSDGLTVYELVSDALQRCFMALLYGETNSDKSRRKLFFGTEQYAQQREALQESFDEDVLINGIDMLSWMKQNQTLKMSVDISGVWETLRFENGGYTALLLTNWIAELLTNAMKYADKSETIKLSFTQQDIALCIGISNSIDLATKNTHGNQHGISSISANIARLNQAVDYENDSMVLIAADTDYHLQLCIASTVFLG